MLLNVRQDVDERKKAAQDKQRNSDDKQPGQLPNDCAPDLYHRATLIAANGTRKYVDELT
jgi:hypothetical protein